MIRFRPFLGVVATAVCLAAGAPAQESAPSPDPRPDPKAPAKSGPRLGVGDLAPRLRVSQWLAGEPVVEFERDRVYVVEFWATWCIPCRRSIPYLTSVQERFRERGVRVVGVSIWEDRPAEVAPFVQRQGEAMRYSVASDFVYPGAKPNQGHMVLNWMNAAGESSIPTAFIVDRVGKIAWIGESLSVEAPLEQIVAGTWDLAAAREAHKQRMLVNQLSRTCDEQIKAKQWTAALATIDELIRLAPEREARAAHWRFHCLLAVGRDEEAYAYARKMVDGPLAEDPLGLNTVAWWIVDPDAPRKHARDLEFALRVAARAVELTEGKEGAILDTLALIHFELGDFERAVEIQEKAVELSKGRSWYEEVVERLEKFRKARDDERSSKAGGGKGGLVLR